MNAFDPEQITDGKRQIAAHYYPLIGPYDSGDPAVIEYHLLLMKLTGIDGIIVDWYGRSDLFDYPVVHKNTQTLFSSAAKIGLRVGICYEDQTITKLVETKRLAADDRISYGTRELEWVRANWFANPSYLRWHDRPVLLSFGQEGLSDGEWEQVLHALGDAPVYLSEHRQRHAAAGAFDWPQPQIGLESLARYYATVKGQSVFLPVAFPRFHDSYKDGKVQDGYPQIPDDQGNTFATTFTRAVQSGAPFIQIATWNDWGEGTVIEPSQEFGYRDLETIQKSRQKFASHSHTTPEDLRLPYRLWLLRGRQAQHPELKSELDDIARLLAAEKTSAARQALQHIESRFP